MRKEKGMKTVIYLFSLLATYICAYHGGFATDLILLFMAVGFAYAGYVVCRGVLDLLFFYANLFFSTYLGCTFATDHYYRYVSDDEMSLIIGNLFSNITFAVLTVVIIVFLAIRFFRRKKKA